MKRPRVGSYQSELSLTRDRVCFRGANPEKPPEMPDFLRAYEETPQPKAPGTKISMLGAIGGAAVITGLTALCSIIFPPAIVALPIGLGALAVTIVVLNWASPPINTKGRKPMTAKQVTKSFEYEKAHQCYTKNLQWYRMKTNLRLLPERIKTTLKWVT